MREDGGSPRSDSFDELILIFLSTCLIFFTTVVFFVVSKARLNHLLHRFETFFFLCLVLMKNHQGQPWVNVNWCFFNLVNVPTTCSQEPSLCLVCVKCVLFILWKTGIMIDLCRKKIKLIKLIFKIKTPLLRLWFFREFSQALVLESRQQRFCLFFAFYILVWWNVRLWNICQRVP